MRESFVTASTRRMWQKRGKQLNINEIHCFINKIHIILHFIFWFGTLVNSMKILVRGTCNQFSLALETSLHGRHRPGQTRTPFTNHLIGELCSSSEADPEGEHGTPLFREYQIAENFAD